ncbi:MAG: DUF2905 domain-containing protein [Bacillota bacterium]
MIGFNPGKIFIFLGAGLLILGVIFHLFEGNLSWLGKLPGDIRIQKENFSFYFPITTMILLSLILNILIRIINFFLK